MCDVIEGEQGSRKGEDHARRWSYGIFRGVYPNAKLPFGWYDARVPVSPDPSAYALIEREQTRFRKTARKRAA